VPAVESRLRHEIAEQPDVVADLLVGQRDAIAAIAGELREHPPALVVTVARGTSDNAARYAQFLFGWMLGLPVALATPSLVTLYGTPPNHRDALVLGISQSGASPDIVAVMEDANRQGATTVAITNEPSSPLATAARRVIDLGARPERAVAATKTYTASLAAVASLVTAIAGDRTRRRELDRVPERMRAQLDREERVADALDIAAPWDRSAVIGRGANYGTAFEIALKVKELTGIAAEPYSPADLLHGPVAVAGPRYPVVAVAPTGPTRASVVDAVAEARRRGSPAIVIADDMVGAEGAEAHLPLVATPDWLSPVVAVVPGQLLAAGLAERRGLDVDRPFGLSKVTRTT
jgi:glucosamine--fructose-6-phosphate aminotransferase (isomerizing)